MLGEELSRLWTNDALELTFGKYEKTRLAWRLSLLSLEILANTERTVLFKDYRDKWQQAIKTVFRSRGYGVCNVSISPAIGLEASRFSAAMPR